MKRLSRDLIAQYPELAEELGAATRAVTAWESGEPAETVMATLRDAVMREGKR